MQGRHRRFRLAPGTPLIGRKCHFSYGVSVVTRLLHRTGYSVQMTARPNRACPPACAAGCAGTRVARAGAALSPRATTSRLDDAHHLLKALIVVWGRLGTHCAAWPGVCAGIARDAAADRPGRRPPAAGHTRFPEALAALAQRAARRHRNVLAAAVPGCPGRSSGPPNR
ncbi:winged helix-turn-helix domain-containing protein [Streptomyces sp. MK7]|uniref:winged helix-turn-helix domain-containing protein n=1 Tax=Streptomyces sp. MK7 TaxID=3067635 RepID=UPI002930CC33|nr:winged helix-turn-helix domain-containing protein [Streptomyces sp. MK7]